MTISLQPNRRGNTTATARVIGRPSSVDTQSLSASPTSSFHSPRNSPRRIYAAKRRKIIIYAAIGVALFGYFFEIIQLSRRLGSDGSSHQQAITIDLPDSVDFSSKFNANKTSNDEINLPSASPQNIIPNKEEWDRFKAITRNRAEQRRKRTRPPNKSINTHSEDYDHSVSTANIETETAAPQLILDLPIHRSLNESVDKTYLSERNKNVRSNTKQQSSRTICGVHAHDASRNDSANYPSSAYIGPESRVIVTGALTQIGMEIILQLYKDCGTEYILGIDPVIPNTRHDRLAALQRYRFLYQNVPSFQKLRVPIFGVAPHPKSGEEIHMESVGRAFDIVERFNPTHIVHLMGLEEGRGEFGDFGDIYDVSPYSTGGYGSMMRRYQNLVSMDQILASIARFKKKEQGSNTQPQLVYVSSAEVGHQSGVSMVGGMKDVQDKASVYGTCSLLKEVLASYYYRHHGVESVGIRVSTIYGPFARSGSFMHGLTNQIVKSTVEKDGGHYSLETIWTRRNGVEDSALEQFVYASDLAHAFVAAMQFKGGLANGPALMQLGSKDIKSMKEIEREIKSYLPSLTQTAEPEQSAGWTDEVSASLVTASHDPSISDKEMKRNLHLLGWSHETKIQDGLRSMLAWQIMNAYPILQPSSASSIKEFLDTSPFPYVGLSSTLPSA